MTGLSCTEKRVSQGCEWDKCFVGAQNLVPVWAKSNCSDGGMLEEEGVFCILWLAENFIKVIM